MKNKSSWTPSKFVLKNKNLRASSDLNQVSAGSRLMANTVANFYQEKLEQYATGRLLDLGCGQVPLYEAYKNHITENICVDWPSSPHQTKFLDHKCDLNKALPFEDNEFDTIILSDVLEHIYEPEQLWAEMHRILKKGGVLLLNVPFFYCVHEAPYDYYRYTNFSLERFANKQDFNLITLEAMGGTPEVLSDIIAKHLQFIPLIGKPSAIFIQWITSVLVRTKVGKQLSIKTSEAFPYGYFVVAKK